MPLSAQEDGASEIAARLIPFSIILRHARVILIGHCRGTPVALAAA